LTWFTSYIGTSCSSFSINVILEFFFGLGSLIFLYKFIIEILELLQKADAVEGVLFVTGFLKGVVIDSQDLQFILESLQILNRLIKRLEFVTTNAKYFELVEVIKTCKHFYTVFVQTDVS
jgi:hypothetical protein